jgi:hypothetical protein
VSAAVAGELKVEVAAAAAAAAAAEMVIQGKERRYNPM